MRPCAGGRWRHERADEGRRAEGRHARVQGRRGDLVQIHRHRTADKGRALLPKLVIHPVGEPRAELRGALGEEQQAVLQPHQPPRPHRRRVRVGIGHVAAHLLHPREALELPHGQEVIREDLRPERHLERRQAVLGRGELHGANGLPLASGRDGDEGLPARRSGVARV